MVVLFGEDTAAVINGSAAVLPDVVAAEERVRRRSSFLDEGVTKIICTDHSNLIPSSGKKSVLVPSGREADVVCGLEDPGFLSPLEANVDLPSEVTANRLEGHDKYLCP